MLPLVIRDLVKFLSFGLFLLAVLCAIGVATGYVLHWAIPSVSLEIGVLTGVVATGWAIDYICRMMSLIFEYERGSQDAAHDDLDVALADAIRRAASPKRSK
jgi:uncharacterized membrane protein